jgi:hypothetical protein
VIARASSGVIDDYMRANAVRKLQIGAGENNKPGWLNTDIEPTIGQAYLDPFRCPTAPFATYTASR